MANSNARARKQRSDLIHTRESIAYAKRRMLARLYTLRQEMRAGAGTDELGEGYLSLEGEVAGLTFALGLLGVEVKDAEV
jgi:hypothetical protein